jgi:GTPase SAR1 family protein
MNKIFLKFFLTTIILTTCLILYNNRFNYKTIFTRQYINRTTNSNYSHDSSSENKEWQILNNNLFIRVKTAFYFVDVKKISIFLQCLDEFYGDDLNYLKFAFHIKLYNKKDPANKIAQFYLQNINAKFFSRRMPPVKIPITSTNVQLYALLDLEMFNETRHIDLMAETHMSLEISALDKNTNKFTSTEPDSIHVVIKHRYTQKQAIYFCAEPSYLEDKNHVDLKWLVELNRQIGFDRVIISNSSVPNTKDFNEILVKNRDILEVVQYNYLPNFLHPNSSQRFVNSLEDLVPKGVEFTLDHLNFVVPVDIMAYTECIFNNIDKARKIFIGDIDETFIPSKLPKFDTKQQSIETLSKMNLKNEIEAIDFNKNFLKQENCINSLKSNETFLQSYLNSIYRNSNIPNENSIYISSLLYLKDDLTEEIFKQMEFLLANLPTLENLSSNASFQVNSSSLATKFPLKIKIFKKHVPTQTKNFVFYDASYDVNCFITMNDEFELKYARSLLSLYKYVLKPFLKENAPYLQYESERLSRFFYMDTFGSGKSFLNTKSAQFMADPHL